MFSWKYVYSNFQSAYHLFSTWTNIVRHKTNITVAFMVSHGCFFLHQARPRLRPLSGSVTVVSPVVCRSRGEPFQPANSASQQQQSGYGHVQRNDSLPFHLPLRNMLSLGALRMWLGCSGNFFPLSPSPPPSSPTSFQKMTCTIHLSSNCQDSWKIGDIYFQGWRYNKWISTEGRTPRRLVLSCLMALQAHISNTPTYKY